jgi:hypothetical protein
MTTFMSQRDKEVWTYLSEALPIIKREFDVAIYYYTEENSGTTYFNERMKQFNSTVEMIVKCQELVKERLEHE